MKIFGIYVFVTFSQLYHRPAQWLPFQMMPETPGNNSYTAESDISGSSPAPTNKKLTKIVRIMNNDFFIVATNGLRDEPQSAGGGKDRLTTLPPLLRHPFARRRDKHKVRPGTHGKSRNAQIERILNSGRSQGSMKR